jgi:peptide deformylase
MTVLRILNYPDPRLKYVAGVVQDVKDPAVQSMLDDMLETLEKTESCGGLAACQLDIAKPLRIFVYWDFDETNPISQTIDYFINPEIVSTEGDVFEKEGCMSVYCDNINEAVYRPKKTTLRGIDREGNVVEKTREGYLAKLYIHETDHLNGKLFIDHLKPLKRKMVDRKIEKIRKAIKKNARTD